jgi:predicted DNA-binding transcriptional regulator AlpA
MAQSMPISVTGMETPQVMSIAALAVVLGISRSHCYALAARDALPVPVIRLGSRMVVSRRMVEELLGYSLAA